MFKGQAIQYQGKLWSDGQIALLVAKVPANWLTAATVSSS